MTEYRSVLVLFALAGILANNSDGQNRNGGSLDVCTAVAIRNHRTISIRGTGWNSPDGLVIGDRTCPVAQHSTHEVPAMILLDHISFASAQDRSVLEKSPFSRRGVSDPFQIHARGALQCQTDFQFRLSDDGDIVAGNGYGPYGLIKCKLVNAEILRLRQLD
jgi:hypothetical protein